MTSRTRPQPHEPMSLAGLVTRDALLVASMRRGVGLIAQVEAHVETQLVDAASRRGVHLNRRGITTTGAYLTNGDFEFTTWCCTEHAPSHVTA